MITTRGKYKPPADKSEEKGLHLHIEGNPDEVAEAVRIIRGFLQEASGTTVSHSVQGQQDVKLFVGIPDNDQRFDVRGKLSGTNVCACPTIIYFLQKKERDP